jgi:hypothetical protein
VSTRPRRLHAYGSIPDQPDRRDFIYAPARITSLPALVDLSHECPPVYNQGKLNSCSAQALDAGELLRELEASFGALAIALPNHLAVVNLFDPDTGAVVSVMDATHITAIRTAAAAVVYDPRRGRTNASEITVYKAMGIALEEMVAANLAYRGALRRGIGTTIEL